MPYSLTPPYAGWWNLQMYINADQFGGETGQKKLTRKRFKDLILSIQSKTLQEQGITLDKFITEYRKEIEQIDDILVMGVKI